MEKTDEGDKRFKYLTTQNYIGWHKRLVEESLNLVGIYELLTTGVEKRFDIIEPEYRIRAITEGARVTPENRILNGFIIDAGGEYLTVSEAVRSEIYKKWQREVDRIEAKKEKYEMAKRIIKKYIVQHLGTEIKEMLINEGPEYRQALIEDNIKDLMKVIKKVAMGRGNSSVVLDGQAVMNMKLKNDSILSILTAVNTFKEKVEQLKEGRTDKEIVNGLLNGVFLTLFAP